MRTPIVLFMTIAMALSTAADVATSGGIDNSYATIAPGGEGSVLYNRIDGAGYPFTAAHLPDGSVVDATITLTLLDDYGQPIPHHAGEDFWLDTSAGGLVYPAGGTIADGPTDENGQTRWRNPLAAGGCSVGETVHVMVAGQPLNQPGLHLAFVSADINGDMVVNLADLSIFAAAYLGDYDECADLFVDGGMTLSDLSLFSQVYHH
jgi:hypothetical protein